MDERPLFARSVLSGFLQIRGAEGVLCLGDGQQRGVELDKRRVDGGVLRGAGDKAFSAGADLSGMSEGAGFAELHDARGELARMFDDVWSMGKPTMVE